MEAPRCFGYIYILNDTGHVREENTAEYKTRRLEEFANNNELIITRIYLDIHGRQTRYKPRNGLNDLLKIMKPGDTLLLFSIKEFMGRRIDLSNIVELMNDKVLISISEHIDTRITQGRFQLTMLSDLHELLMEEDGEPLILGHIRYQALRNLLTEEEFIRLDGIVEGSPEVSDTEEDEIADPTNTNI